MSVWQGSGRSRVAVTSPARVLAARISLAAAMALAAPGAKMVLEPIAQPERGGGRVGHLRPIVSQSLVRMPIYMEQLSASSEFCFCRSLLSSKLGHRGMSKFWSSAEIYKNKACLRPKIAQCRWACASQELGVLVRMQSSPSRASTQGGREGSPQPKGSSRLRGSSQPKGSSQPIGVVATQGIAAARGVATAHGAVAASGIVAAQGGFSTQGARRSPWARKVEIGRYWIRNCGKHD